MKKLCFYFEQKQVQKPLNSRHVSVCILIIISSISNNIYEVSWGYHLTDYNEALHAIIYKWSSLVGIKETGF